jgi:hypothetical protein
MKDWVVDGAELRSLATLKGSALVSAAGKEVRW